MAPVMEMERLIKTIYFKYEIFPPSIVVKKPSLFVGRLFDL